MAVDPHALPPIPAASEEALLLAAAAGPGAAMPWIALAAGAFALAAALRSGSALRGGRAQGAANEKRPDARSGQSNREVRDVVPRMPS